MDTFQENINDNFKFQSLISKICPTKNNEIFLYFGDEKRTPSRHIGKESDILLTRVYKIFDMVFTTLTLTHQFFLLKALLILI